MSSPTLEQQNNPGYRTKYELGTGRLWWSLDGIDWYPWTEYYYEDPSDEPPKENDKDSQ